MDVINMAWIALIVGMFIGYKLRGNIFIFHDGFRIECFGLSFTINRRKRESKRNVRKLKTGTW